MNAWDEWLLKKKAEIREEQVPQPKDKKTKEPVVTREITDDELARVKRLRRVSTSRGSQDRRFINQMEDMTRDSQITERQAWYLLVLEYKYRRQIGINPPKPAGYEGRGR